MGSDNKGKSTTKTNW